MPDFIGKVVIIFLNFDLSLDFSCILCEVLKKIGKGTSTFSLQGACLGEEKKLFGVLLDFFVLLFSTKKIQTIFSIIEK